jgi:MFS transporter, Spinster family, sphingosine-1-phosphate transporter
MSHLLFSRNFTTFWCLTLLTGLNLLNYFNRHFISAVLSPIKESLLLTDGDLGRTATVFMLGYTISSPAFGIIGDRWNRKWLVFLGVIIWCLATLGTGRAFSFETLVISQLLVGIGQALFTAVSPSIISDVYAPAKRNFAFTVFFVGIPIGSALSFLIGGYLDQKFGWRNAFYISALPGLALAMALIPFADPHRGQTDNTVATLVKPNLRNMLSLFKLRDFNLNSFGYTAYHFALGAYAFWGPTFLVRSFDFSFPKASMLFGGILVGAGLLGTLAGGYWASVLQKKGAGGYARVCALSNFATVPFALLAFWTPNQFVAIFAIAITMFIAFLPTGPMNTLVVETSPSHLRSSGMALSMFLIHMCGDMWSPEIVGRIADFSGSLTLGLSILPLAFLLAGILWTGLARFQIQNFSPKLEAKTA